MLKGSHAVDHFLLLQGRGDSDDLPCSTEEETQALRDDAGFSGHVLSKPSFPPSRVDLVFLSLDAFSQGDVQQVGVGLHRAVLPGRRLSCG